jgi:lysophospholipase L1-like esterase
VVSTTRSGDVALRYVALGDSYTIGTAVTEVDAFPTQLAAAVPRLDLVANLGVDGYTSADLVRDELPAFESLQPSFATVLVGVNDVVQRVPLERYEANVTAILAALRSYLPASRIVAVGVPDYTVTPQGGAYGDPDGQRAGIVAVNASMARLAAADGVRFVEVFDLSRRAGHDRSLVADDGLHPSAAQYALWVERIAPVVASLLEG